MRLWELDCVKGIAILLVMLFHFVFDLAFFAQFPINIDSWLWWSIARIASSLFILTAGLFLTIGSQKGCYTTFNFLLKVFLRSLKLLSLGMLITGTTWFFIGEGTIVFGILHFLAVAPLCGLLLAQYPAITLITAFVIFLFTPWVHNTVVSTYALVWLGFQPHDFYSLDHFPFFPWLGVYLLGMFLGSLVYPQATRRISLTPYPPSRISKLLSFIGQHTLLLYLLHQPFFIALIYLLVPSSRNNF